MSNHCYFDIVPVLTSSEADKRLWQAFLEEVKAVYLGTGLLVEEDDYLQFQIGRHLRLPVVGEHILRFGSRVSDTYTDIVEILWIPYINMQ